MKPMFLIAMKPTAVAFASLILLAATAAQAHVKIRPAESKSGATETYTIVVPTEGKVATTSIELEAPSDVEIVSIESSPREMRTSGDHTSITWATLIAPGEHREFRIVAKNPATGGQIAWTAHQHFADGTVTDWIETPGPGARRPGPLTKLVP